MPRISANSVLLLKLKTIRFLTFFEQAEDHELIDFIFYH